jgi:hypothetical protein
MSATTNARRRQIRLTQTIFAGIATVAMLVLFHNAIPDDTALPHVVGAGGFVADGDDDEAQLQQQLQTQQEIQQSEQQAEEQEQLDLQEAQQAEQQGQLTEQQATQSVPGS